MNCSKCNALIKEGNLFCGSCGAQVDINVKSTSASSEKSSANNQFIKQEHASPKPSFEPLAKPRINKNSILLVVGVAIVLLVGIIIYLSTSTQGSRDDAGNNVVVSRDTQNDNVHSEDSEPYHEAESTPEITLLRFLSSL